MKGNIYDLINPTWKSDATPNQIDDSEGWMLELERMIRVGHYDNYKNSDFQEEISKMPVLIREDRLKLYKYFRQYKTKP